MEAILLGNGLNCNAVNGNVFYREAISDRFLDKVIDLIPVFEKWSGLLNVFNKNHLKASIKYCEEWNIERVAHELMVFLKNRFELNEFSDTIRLRYLRYLKAIAIFSIFYTNSKKCAPIIPAKFIDVMNKYGKVFSLNYFERWDKFETCIYLHGKLSYEELPDCEVNLRLADINTSGIIFAPDDMDKLVADAVYSSNTLYPSEDLFPGSERYDLYEKLSTVTALEVFGVSPYGDTALIETISSISKVTIYVHNRFSDNGQKEIKKWMEAFYPIVPIIYDTDDFVM